jgi:vacuolar-type H+-ATPase subunit F/Vma7
MGKFVIDHKLNGSIMAEVLTKEQTIDEIVKVARKLDKMDFQILLMRLRIKKMVKEKRRPVANYDSRKIKAPTMEEINAWTHEARKQHAGK